MINETFFQAAKQLSETITDERMESVMDSQGHATGYVAFRDYRGNLYVLADTADMLPKVDTTFYGRKAYAHKVVNPYPSTAGWGNI